MDSENSDPSFVWNFFLTPERAKEVKKKYSSYTHEFNAYLLIQDMENSYQVEGETIVNCLLNFIQEMRPSLSF